MKKCKTLSALLILMTVISIQTASAVKITFGTKCHPDGQGACVGDRGICLIIEIKKQPAAARTVDPSTFLGDDMAYGELTMAAGGLMRLDIIAHRSDVAVDGEFTVEEPVILSDELSREFGYREIILLPGVYTVDFSTSRLGTVQLPIAVR